MRAKIKSVWYIIEIFLCILDYICKSDIFSTYPNLDETNVFCYFKGQTSKCHIHKELLKKVLGHAMTVVSFYFYSLIKNHPVVLLYIFMSFIIHSFHGLGPILRLSGCQISCFLNINQLNLQNHIYFYAISIFLAYLAN